MKTITLHLTLSAAVQKYRVHYLKQRIKAIRNLKYTQTPKGGGKTRERVGGMPGKNAHPIRRMKTPGNWRWQEAGLGHVEAGIPPPRETAMIMIVMII